MDIDQPYQIELANESLAIAQKMLGKFIQGPCFANLKQVPAESSQAGQVSQQINHWLNVIDLDPLNRIELSYESLAKAKNMLSQYLCSSNQALNLA